MEAEAVLNLFDSRWFYHLQKQLQTSFSSNPDHEISRQSSSSQLATSSSFNKDMPSPLEIPKAPQITTKKKWLSKSLSELEFEELKGFMDLGFVFSEQDKDDSHLVQIIPGLQKMEIRNELLLLRATKRPYLSEAWEALIKTQNEESQLMKWRVPPIVNEIGMKDNLKLWAHTVASSVR